MKDEFRNMVEYYAKAKISVMAAWRDTMITGKMLEFDGNDMVIQNIETGNIYFVKPKDILDSHERLVYDPALDK